MNAIIEKKRNMESVLDYYTFKIVLYEDPEGAMRPRFRLINRSNIANAAIASPNFVHVYSPNAANDSRFLHRLLENELPIMNQFVQTPCQMCINTYHKMPSYFSQIDTVLAEIGLHRQYNKPDWDNIGKKYSDMFNANVWLDDQMVQDGEVHKYYSILPRVEIFVQYLNYCTNHYQYDRIINRKDYRENHPIKYLDQYGRPSN